MTVQPDSADLAGRLFSTYDSFREAALFQRRFRQADILPLIEARGSAGVLEVSEEGLSFEGRSIRMLKAGHGYRKVLFWSQMHGDEPTATMALFDIFNFLEGRDDGFDGFRERLFDSVTLYFVPMLNPDGAERYQRPTAQMIDMNRDALALQTPESRILKGLIERLQPDFGFNLHDQNPRYTAGRSANLATISFLATSYDYALSVNDVRLRSMQLIARMNEVLQRYIPGQVGRFSDDHEPRAFGDNIQKWGTTLVLVESGGYRGDPEKQYIRRLNYVALLSALASIAGDSYREKTREEYEAIPLNERMAYDLIIRGVTVRQSGKSYSIDIGINREEVNCEGAKGFYYYSEIGETGDLRTYSGLEEIREEGLVFENGKIYPFRAEDCSELAGIDFPAMMREGYTYLRMSGGGLARAGGHTGWPVHLIGEVDALPDAPVTPGEIPTFVLKKDGNIRYVVVNGFVYDAGGSGSADGNGIVGR